MYYDNFAVFQLSESLDEWEDGYVIGVRFAGKLSKIYHYFTTRENHFCGEQLDGYFYPQHSQKRVTVSVVGYSSTDAEATKELDFTPRIRKTAIKKELNMTSIDKITANTKDVLNETKDVIIKTQKGKLVLQTVKTALLNVDAVPKKVKDFIVMDGYGDLAVGMLLNIAAKTADKSETLSAAAKDANFVGAIEFSAQFTFLQDALEGVLDKIYDIGD
jgi:hypothetical protein